MRRRKKKRGTQTESIQMKSSYLSIDKVEKDRGLFLVLAVAAQLELVSIVTLDC